MAKKRKLEATGEDNLREHTGYFETLLSNASLQQLGAWLVELALIHHRDHAPYAYYGDSKKPDSLFETATRWGLDVEVIKAAVVEPVKPNRTKGEAGSKRRPKANTN